MRQKEVRLIIPAYNEEKNIEKVMKQLAYRHRDCFYVLVMNYASSDNVQLVAKKVIWLCGGYLCFVNLGYGSGCSWRANTNSEG